MRFFYSVFLSVTLLVASAVFMLWANYSNAGEAMSPPVATVSLDGLVANAINVVKAFDGGSAKQVWDASSQQTKKYQTKDVFAKSIGDSRKPLGEVVARKWTSIESVEITKAANVMPGNYINVLFASNFAGSKEWVRESVTYTVENGNWYFAGYMLLLPPVIANPVGGFAPPSAAQGSPSAIEQPSAADSKAKPKKK